MAPSSSPLPPAMAYRSEPAPLPSPTPSTCSTASIHARTRLTSFVAAVLTSLCAGSITVFSLYGHIFQERLRYTQLQVNGVAIGSSVALYLPVSILGYVCDRYGTVPLSLFSALLFGTGYGLAATVYRHVETMAHMTTGGPQGADIPAWSYGLMVFAFVCIGVGTSAMYLSAVATCAKNFGKGKHRGLALSSPIAGFGLSGIWLSQVGSRFFSTVPQGIMLPPELDVYHYFIFLGILLTATGVAGAFTLRIVDEDDLIEEAADELGRSGFLEPPLLSRTESTMDYGTVYYSIEPTDYQGTTDVAEESSLIMPPSYAMAKKDWLLNAETKSFLQDRTMWLFALGFLFMVGPGEAFINNLGTVISSLNSHGAVLPSSTFRPTSPATHVSILSITSTASRLITGSLTDLLAPSPATQHVQLDGTAISRASRNRPAVSRVIFLLTFAAMLSLGLLALASGAIQDHGERFWIVSALVGAGYGAVFSLTPIIITIIWGVENFATNWGIVAMLPALGSTFWGLVYSAVYQAGADSEFSGGRDVLDGAPSQAEEKPIFCYGAQCYAPTFWGMTVTVWVACGLILIAWKGRGGWATRGIVI
ncbi:putative transporter MCH1 [Ceratocystis lukuohia]|uniref:Probable transporter MCH1 n=2 Tax=Ceratocystis TaxID=5157 RepID=A0A0F8B1V7_CERFI|nr:putative transporter MCH1 [Ceratocystis platani]